MDMNDILAREIIRERTAHKVHTQRPSHPRAARLLRRVAQRLEG
jgi:hypothetical protein